MLQENSNYIVDSKNIKPQEVVIKSSGSKLDKVIVAFGWWEKSTC